jgi:hypothetical protein
MHPVEIICIYLLTSHPRTTQGFLHGQLREARRKIRSLNKKEANAIIIIAILLNIHLNSQNRSCTFTINTSHYKLI